MNRRLERENFERVSRLLQERAAKSASSSGVMTSDEAIGRLIEAARYRRYKVSPEVAVAFVKALLGSREASFDFIEGHKTDLRRPYLRKLVKTVLPILRAKAIPPQPGRRYHLTVHEQHRLIRSLPPLVKFFEAGKAAKISLADLNRKLDEIYPRHQFNDMTVSKADLPDILRFRTPRARAIAVLERLYPIGTKAIQRLCPADAKGTTPVRSVSQPSSKPP